MDNIQAEKSLRIHDLKTIQPFFDDVFYGEKCFEVRKNDRGFQIGDFLHLQEYDVKTGYSGREVYLKVSYILNGGQFGIEKGYCIMGFELPSTIDLLMIKCENGKVYRVDRIGGA